MEKILIYPNIEDIGKRLDLFIFEKLGQYSRSNIQKFIETGAIKQASKVITKVAHRVTAKPIEVTVPEPQKLSLEPEAKELDIAYEDQYIVVVDKPSGITVHPGAGISTGTLVNFLLHSIKDLSSIGGVIRPGIVHRLDKETSGLIIVAKNNEVHTKLSELFKSKQIKKRYIALVHGNPVTKSRTIRTKIARNKFNRKKMAVCDFDGRDAVTSYTVIDEVKGYSLLSVIIETGRTHQIRVHLSHIGYPVVGDKLYGRQDNVDRHMLHCYELEFEHPISGQKLKITAKLPADFKKLVEKLKLMENEKII